METRPLGNSGINVAPLAFGGNVFGWTIDEPTSFEILDGFVGAGFNLIDTADVYSVWKEGNQGGESETIIGNWLAKHPGMREKVVIATKVGMRMGAGREGLSKKYILQECEESLRRLQTDYIDLYQSHKDDERAPLDETLEAYGRLIQDGKARAIGASNYGPDRLAEALTLSDESDDLPRYETLQPEYNLYDRAGYEDGLELLCRKYGLGVIPYFSLASGFLTGKYRSQADLAQSQRGGRVQKYLTERGMRILAILDAVAAQYAANPAQVSLAWLVARPSITAPIASATSTRQLADLIAGARLNLDKESIDRLDLASAGE